MDATMSATDPIGRRAADVQQRVNAAAHRSGRSPSGITVVAVSKTFGDDAIRQARDAGLMDFGESKAQTLRARLDAEPPLQVRWHFVGRLQRNKVELVNGNATLIHSVDRLSLAEAIAEHSAAAGSVQRVLVQVNISDDPAKGGFLPDDTAAAVAKIRDLPGISVQGLMTIPALDADPAQAYERMRRLRDDLRARFPEVLHLSMGMSNDYETAIEHGATLVRIGTNIFGPRG